jgi:MFS family permease
MKKKRLFPNLEANLRRNILVNIGDVVFTEAANGMTPLNTIIASLLRTLTPSKTLITMVGALNGLVQFIPQLWSARKMERTPRLKPLLIYYATIQRLIWLVFAGLTIWVLPWQGGGLFIPLFIIGYVFFGYFSGQFSLVWINYTVNLIPPNGLGRFLGFRAAIGSAAAIGGALLSKCWLEGLSFPYNYGFIFVMAGVLGALSLLFLANTIEAEAPVRERPPRQKRFAKRIMVIIKTDRNFQTYFLSTIFITFGKMAFPLQVVYAQEVLGIGVGQVALASVALMAGQMVGYLFWGWLVDRTSFKMTIVMSTFFFVPSLLLSYFMVNEWMLYGAVAVFAFSQAARNFGENGLVMELCSAENRSIYIGLRNGLLGPILAASTILGGILTDLASYSFVILLAIPLIIIGAFINLWMVKPVCQPAPRKDG